MEHEHENTHRSNSFVSVLCTCPAQRFQSHICSPSMFQTTRLGRSSTKPKSRVRDWPDVSSMDIIRQVLECMML